MNAKLIFFITNKTKAKEKGKEKFVKKSRFSGWKEFFFRPEIMILTREREKSRESS